MDNSIKDINHSLSIQAETLGEPAETEASWYAMRVFMNKVALCRDLFNLFNNALKDPDQMKNTFPEDMMGDVMEYYAPFVKERHVNSQGKKIVVERPLIPSLFFMRSNKRQALCLERELCGKARLYRQLVDFDPQPIAIPKRQMQMFMMVSSGDQEGLEYSRMEPSTGRKVNVSGSSTAGSKVWRAKSSASMATIASSCR